MNEFVVATAPLASVTRTVTARFSTPLGVPLITPVEAFKLKPSGKVPLAIEKVRGVAPPDELTVREYAELNVPERPELGVIRDNADDTVNDLDTVVAAL